MTGSRMEQWASENFEIVPGYLNTATLGLPTRASLAHIRSDLADWQAGVLAVTKFDGDVARSRAAYASIAGTTSSHVAIVGQVSGASALVASSCEPGATVLCAEGDFTSVLFPFLGRDDITVRLVAPEAVVDSITEDIDLVAVSAVQSSNGLVIDLDALAEAGSRAGVRTYLDVTQGSGWLDFDADRFDVTVAHAYKWLCCPRGAGFLTVNDAGAQWLQPGQSGWYAGDDPWTSIYGSPLRLARDARKYDLSPAWFSFSGAAATLEILAAAGPAAIGDYSIGLANSLRSELGLEPSNSPIVSIETDAGDAIAEAGITCSQRAGRTRISFYVYNTFADVEAVAAAIRSERVSSPK